MEVDGVAGDEHSFRDLSVGQTLGDEARDRAFGVGETSETEQRTTRADPIRHRGASRRRARRPPSRIGSHRIPTRVPLVRTTSIASVAPAVIIVFGDATQHRLVFGPHETFGRGVRRAAMRWLANTIGCFEPRRFRRNCRIMTRSAIAPSSTSRSSISRAARRARASINGLASRVGAREIDDTENMSGTRIRDRRGRARQRSQRIREVLAPAYNDRLACGDRGSDCVRADGRLRIDESRSEMDSIEPRAERTLGYPSVEDVAVAAREQNSDIRRRQVVGQRAEHRASGSHEEAVAIAVSGVGHGELFRREPGARGAAPRRPDVVAHLRGRLAPVQHRLEGGTQPLWIGGPGAHRTSCTAAGNLRHSAGLHARGGFTCRRRPEDWDMRNPSRHPSTPDLLVPTLLLLTATTGLVDAVAFLGLGHVFTANMTGNVVFTAFAIAGAKGLSVSASVLALVCFLAGALAGGRLAVAMEPRSRRQWLVIATSGEALLLAGAAVAAIGVPLSGTFGQRWPIVVLTAAAMGIRNATVRRLGAADLTTTVLTLTLTGLAADSSFAGGSNPRPTRRLGSVVAMFAGALIGAVLVLHQGLVWPLAIACTIAVLAVVSFLSQADATAPDHGAVRV